MQCLQQSQHKIAAVHDNVGMIYKIFDVVPKLLNLKDKTGKKTPIEFLMQAFEKGTLSSLSRVERNFFLHLRMNNKSLSSYHWNFFKTIWKCYQDFHRMVCEKIIWHSIKKITFLAKRSVLETRHFIISETVLYTQKTLKECLWLAQKRKKDFKHHIFLYFRREKKAVEFTGCKRYFQKVIIYIGNIFLQHLNDIFIGMKYKRNPFLKAPSIHLKINKVK